MCDDVHGFLALCARGLALGENFWPEYSQVMLKFTRRWRDLMPPGESDGVISENPTSRERETADHTAREQGNVTSQRQFVVQ